jgi:hypothetical protein
MESAMVCDPTTRSRSDTMSELSPSGEVADDVVTKPSTKSVDETVSRLSAMATGKGMHVFAVIDHSGEARNVGLQLNLILPLAATGTSSLAKSPSLPR